MYNQLRGDLRSSDVPTKTSHVDVPGTGSSTKWLLTMALVCTIGFVVARFARTDLKTRTVVDDAPHPAVSLPAAQTENPAHHLEGTLAIKLPAAETEDLLRHLDSATAAEKNAAAALRRSQDWTNRALPSLDDGSLATRRLQLANSADKAAEAQMNHAREELEIAKRILTERSEKP